jgi:hypothetical protein
MSYRVSRRRGAIVGSKDYTKEYWQVRKRVPGLASMRMRLEKTKGKRKRKLKQVKLLCGWNGGCLFNC